MMARQHVTFGVAIYVPTVYTLANGFEINSSVVNWHWNWTPAAGWNGAEPLPLLMQVFVVGLFLLAPDLDHKNSTLTRKLGIFGKILYPIITFLSGGHRYGMHSWILPAMTGGILMIVSSFAEYAEIVRYLTAVLVVFSATIILRFLVPGYKAGSRFSTILFLVLLALVFLAFWKTPTIMDGYWLPIAAASGALLHDLGDWFTKAPVFFLYPFTDKGFKAPVGFPVGGVFESYVLRTVFLAASAAAMFFLILKPLALDLPGIV